MKTSERFALNEWLSDYPDDKTYDEIIELMIEDEYQTEEINPWYVVQDHTLGQIIEFIENTRMHFERVTERETA
jgi:inorganic pyrophosphatase